MKSSLLPLYKTPSCLPFPPGQPQMEDASAWKPAKCERVCVERRQKLVSFLGVDSSVLILGRLDVQGSKLLSCVTKSLSSAMFFTCFRESLRTACLPCTSTLAALCAQEQHGAGLWLSSQAVISRWGVTTLPGCCQASRSAFLQPPTHIHP